MADIFLSYKKERRAHAERLAAVLEAYGYSVWWDYELAVGPDFRDQIEAKLEVSKVVIVLWCSGAVRSKFVRSEASRADKRGKLVQAYLEWVEPPLGFEEAQGQPLVNWAGEAEGEVLSGLLAALARLLGERPRMANVIRVIGRMEPLAAIEPILHVEEEEAEPTGATALVAPAQMAAPARLASASSSRWALIEKSLDARDYEDFLEVFPSAPEAFEARRHRRQLEDWARIDVSASRAVEAFLKDPIKAASLFPALEAHARAEMRRAAEAERRAAEEREAAERNLKNVEARAAEDTRRRLPGAEFCDGEGLPLMLTLPQGVFRMGELEPTNKIIIDYVLAVGKSPVTVGQFRNFIEATGRDMGNSARIWSGAAFSGGVGRGWHNPGFPQDDTHPVTCVSWEDARAYVSWLAAVTFAPYRLLTEAEWEYACQTPTFYDYRHEQFKIDPFVEGNIKGTMPVEQSGTNKFGLLGMRGNVWEWVEDCWSRTYPKLMSDGAANTDGDCSKRVLRWDCSITDGRELRTFDRMSADPKSRGNHNSFRVAMTL